METIDVRLSLLAPNTGQIPGFPGNPRQWTREEIIRLAASIEETPELLAARPILAVQHDGKYVVIGGNLRLAALAHLGRKTAPVFVIPADTTPEKLKELVIKDNGSFGSWDWDALANEWDDLPLTNWGVPAWNPEEDLQRQMNKEGLSSKGREGGEGYDEFVNKFAEELPLTTDDCYTPTEVYDLVTKFVDEHLTPLKGRKVIRPFYPGGDYENLAQYPKGSIVVDNPPFSIYSKIVRFYLANGIDFFLFGPQLSLLVSEADCCFCPFNCIIVYENGAKVNTGFVTNLRPGVRIWVEHTLRDAIMKAQKQEPTMPVYEYPDEVISSALLGKIANGGDLEIAADECQYVHNLDGMKEIQRGLFGGGFLLARAAAEKARAVKIELSAKEKAIVDQLTRNGKHETETQGAQ